MSPLLAFILTFAIELLVIKFFAKKRWMKTLLYVFLINLFTWPIANMLYGFFPSIEAAIAIEAGVILVESVLISLLFEIGYRKSLFVSAVANVISALVGLFVFVLVPF
jgi:hypothetical protein